MPVFPPIARLLADLTAAGHLPPAPAAAIAQDEATRPFSLHYELRTLLYLGITLLAGGLGVLIYENRNSLSQELITSFIALAMSASFTYAARRLPAFTWGAAPRHGVAADYLLLLGCLLFLVLEGYVQVEYGVFGARYGLATLLPALVFFPLAYRYDHRGVLALGIGALGAWLSVAVAPLAVLRGLFDSRLFAGPALGLGLALVAAGLASERFQLKPHFAFTYLLTGANLAGLGALWRAFDQFTWVAVPWLLLVLALGAALIWYARRTRSYSFLLLGVVYGYVAFTSLGMLVFNRYYVLRESLAMLYFPLTLIGIVWLLLNVKKILRLK